MYVAEPTRIVVIRVVVDLGRKRDDAKKARKKRIYILYICKKKLAFRSLFCSVLRTGLRPKDLNITPSNVNART